MIEFNGYLTGEAEKFYWKKSRRLIQILSLVALSLLWPPILFVSIRLNYLAIIIAYALMCIIIPSLLFIPKRKKEKLLLTPKKIQITDETIICTADKFTDSRFISAVNKVYDYGDFYFISFVFGNISEKYVCQKNLLSEGTLDQFEKIFEPKLVKK